MQRTIGGVQAQLPDSDERVSPEKRGEDLVEAAAHKAQTGVVSRGDIRSRKGDPAARGRNGIFVRREHGVKGHGCSVQRAQVGGREE